MITLTVVLLVVALVLFVLATIGTPSPPRFNLMAAGLAFCVLAMLGGTVRAQERLPLYPPGPNHQGVPSYERDNYPRWCRHYDLRDYVSDRRQCGQDWDCVRRVNRKARICGLR
jgi:hypothetical protein